MSFPADNDASRRWLRAHPLRRKISIRQSDRVSSPLTFGVIAVRNAMERFGDLERHEPGGRFAEIKLRECEQPVYKRLKLGFLRVYLKNLNVTGSEDFLR